MDYLLSQTSQNITYREKSQMDLKAQKAKLEQLMKAVKTQYDNTMKEANNFSKKK